MAEENKTKKSTTKTAGKAADKKKVAENEKELTVLPEGEYISKTEFDKLQVSYQNLSHEHDALVLKHENGALDYQMSQETALKLKEAVDNLKNGKALLFRKLSLALAEVKRIPKSGFNDHFKYKYAQEGDILDGIRPILADVGLALWTDVESQTRELLPIHDKYNPTNPDKTKLKWFTKVKMKFTIACTDSGETISSTYYGEGEDDADKGLYKAYTGATKYFLTKNFLISSGDILQDNEPSDPEADTHMNQDPPKKPQDNDYKRPNRYEGQEPPQGDKNDSTGKGSVIPNKDELLTLWTTLGGSEKDFNGWYTKQAGKGVHHKVMEKYLKDKIAEAEAQKEIAERTAKKEQENTPPPEPENTEPDPQPQDEPKSKNPDEMTPEEYVEYVEENLPFPLTKTEKEQILNDAAQGIRNHGNK